jgi:hypothetical protein
MLVLGRGPIYQPCKLFTRSMRSIPAAAGWQCDRALERQSLLFPRIPFQNPRGKQSSGFLM